MAKRFAAIALSVILLLCGIANAETLKMLDTGDEVLALKKALTAAGYLEATEETTNVFDKATKNAIEELQKDFELEETGIATPEIQVICTLLGKLTETKSTAGQEEADADMVVMPDVYGITAEDAAEALKKLGLYVIFTERYDDSQEGTVCYTGCKPGEKLKKGSKVIVRVSKGPRRIDAKHSTWQAWWVKGSKEDNYELYTPYIYEDTLVIILDATLNSEYSLRWRGYGTACITDRFDKTVPIEVKYENEQIKKGETQTITLRIPLGDLDVKKPTTMSVQIELYRGAKTEVHLRMDFTMTW